MLHHGIQPVRITYPHPEPANQQARLDRIKERYCVGGAICLYYHLAYEPFPHEESLAENLRRLNPSLTGARAQRYARHIIASNDENHMPRAWAFAQAALDYQPKGAAHE